MGKIETATILRPEAQGWTPAPLPPSEPQRLSALRALDVLDTSAEPEFDALVRAAAQICGTPISLISLVDDYRQWFKANLGLEGAQETPREVAFCSHAVRGLGLRVALDDFGSGAATFGYLKRLPLDYIKIDGQFVTGLLNDPLDEVTVRSFVDVARVMGLKTVAEFVESAEVMNRLRELGVDFAQGYHLHKPACLDTLCHPDLVPALPPPVAWK